MCSTPKPKRNNQGKALESSTSILATMNSMQRQAFAKRANEVSERRLSQLNNKQSIKNTAYNSTQHRQLISHQNEIKEILDNNSKFLNYLDRRQRPTTSIHWGQLKLFLSICL